MNDFWPPTSLTSNFSGSSPLKSNIINGRSLTILSGSNNQFQNYNQSFTNFLPNSSFVWCVIAFFTKNIPIRYLNNSWKIITRRSGIAKLVARSDEQDIKVCSKYICGVQKKLPIGVLPCCFWDNFSDSFCLLRKYWALILSGKGMVMVIALWNLRLLGSIVTIGLTAPPCTIISSTVSSSTCWTLNPTSTRLTSVLQYILVKGVLFVCLLGRY